MTVSRNYSVLLEKPIPKDLLLPLFMSKKLDHSNKTCEIEARHTETNLTSHSFFLVFKTLVKLLGLQLICVVYNSFAKSFCGVIPRKPIPVAFICLRQK
jgi:hypothetical protein